jgi:fibronectin type 3 domain-containing protein
MKKLIVAAEPSDLAAEGRSDGANYLTWTSNNKYGTVVYEIWRLHGDTAPWALHATTKKQSFTDTPVTPGQVYNYKVRAVAATNQSNYSNTAVVYGTL